MIYVLYIITAAIVTYLSILASKYIDMLDKKTSLSGAFLGGVMLSAITSLPELFTSLSSTLMLDKPGLCIGNILGSDLFNIAVLALLILIFFRSFKNVEVGKSHMIVTILVCLMYVAILLNMFGIINFVIFSISITSIIIAILYGCAIKFLAEEEGEANSDEDDCKLTIKQIIFRFIIASLGIIVFSIIITYITDDIATRLNLGTGLAGAIFLGIATSLPEVVSTITLFKLKNFDIAIGNIIGSNLFNFTILSFADLCYLKTGIYDFSDPNALKLLVFGCIATPLMLANFKFKNAFVRVVTALLVFACYIGFLVA